MILEVPSNPVILWFCVTYLPLLIAGKHLYSLQAGPQVSHFTITWVSLFYPTPVESMADTSLPSGGQRFIIPSHIFSSPSECNQLRKEQAASPSEGPAESALCSAWFWVISDLGKTGGSELKAGKPPAPFLISCSILHLLLHAVASGKALVHQFVIDPCHSSCNCRDGNNN